MLKNVDHCAVSLLLDILWFPGSKPVSTADFPWRVYPPSNQTHLLGCWEIQVSTHKNGAHLRHPQPLSVHASE